MSFHKVSIANESLRPFEPLLRSWIACTEHYVDVWKGNDLPYWYNERANVSIFAGAAWRAGWTAIEEYQVEKVADENGLSTGRNDLYIANLEQGYCIEAKVVYLDISDLDKSSAWLASKCDDAVFDAKKVKSIEDPKLGAVFAVPYSKGMRASEKEIEAFISMIEASPFCALAWVAPKLAQSTSSHDERYYPLAALVLLEA